jgi:HYDIN/CFA65/VesB family protein
MKRINTLTNFLRTRITMPVLLLSMVLVCARWAEYRALDRDGLFADERHPRIILPSLICDLGVVTRGRPYVATFILKNEGTQLLLIHDAEKDGTEARESPVVIPSGASRRLRVSFTPAEGGPVEKRQTFLTNDPKNRKIEFVVRGLVPH